MKRSIFFSRKVISRKGRNILVYRLMKALYGLRQAPRAWYAKLNKCPTDLSFTRCSYEHAVYMKRENDEVLIVGVYVDDLLLTGTSIRLIEEFKTQMSGKFEMSNLGKLTYYLGVEVEQELGI